MAQSFTNFKDLVNYLESQLPISLEMIGEEIKEMLKENVQLFWYDAYEPKDYIRSYELIESLSITKAKKIGNNYEVEIFFDTSKIHPYPPAENTSWSKHQSVLNQDDVSAAIPYYMEYGNNSSLFDLENVHPNGLHIVEDTRQWLKEYDYLKKQMVIFLGQKGFKCNIV